MKYDKNKDNEVVLITGGSGGLGLELAKVMAADGHNLFLVARQGDVLSKVKLELENQYNIKVNILAIDLMAPDAHLVIFNELFVSGLKVNILVNNAGFGLLGNFIDLNLNKQLDIISLNINSLVAVTHLFLRQADNGAKILNISSLAAFQPGPLMSVYYASKAFVSSFSQALSRELKDKKITVTTLCPGPLDTNFWRVSNSNREGVPVSTILARLSPQKVARIGYKGLKMGKRLIIPGSLNKILVLLVKILPESFVLAAVWHLNNKK